MLREPEGKEKYQAKFLYLTDNDETFFALQGNADLVPTSGLDNLVTLQYEAEDTYVLSNHQGDMEVFETYKAQSCSGQTDSECLSNHLAEVQAKRRETAAVSLIPWGGVDRLVKKADKASPTDTAALDAGAKPRQFDDAKAPFSTLSGKDASIPPNAPKVGVGDFFSGEAKPKASDLKSWAESQGWKPTQTTNGPLTYVDSNGVKRLKIKQGSGRAPGSEKPHIEVRNSSSQRIDPATGQPTTRKNPLENYRPIDYDL